MTDARSSLSLLLLLLFGGGAILVFQNSQPLTLVIFGQPLPLTLPLSAWLIGAVIGGLLISVLLQLFLRGGPIGQRGSSPQFERLKQRPARKPNSRTGRSDWERDRANYDWTDQDLEREDGVSWDIETPPTRPTRPRPQPEVRKRPEPYPQSPSQGDRPQPKAKQTSMQPPNPPSSSEQVEKVYDADYRVLTTPVSGVQSPDIVDPDEDGEWI